MSIGTAGDMLQQSSYRYFGVCDKSGDKSRIILIYEVNKNNFITIGWK